MLRDHTEFGGPRQRAIQGGIMTRKHALYAATFASAFALLVSTVAAAQDTAGEAGEIVVTAQKREQNIQNVPISITALGGNSLSQRGTLDTDTLSAAVPSLQISNLGAQGIAIFTIRGVSQNDFSDQNEAPNAIYVDGAYRSFIGAAGFTMFDVDRVEVLRGPQGTLYGRNATGGLVHVINRQPTRSFEAYAEVEGGERSLVEARGAISGPLSDDVQARLSFATKHNDGYVLNTMTGKDQGGANNWSGRFQLRLAPQGSESSLLLSAHYSKDDVNGATIYDNKRAIVDSADPARRIINPTSNAQYLAFCQAVFDANTPVPLAITPTSNCAGWQDPAPNSPYVTQYDNPGYSRRKIYGATVTGHLAVTDAINLVTISDYLRLDRSIGVDTDGTGFRMFNFFSDAKSKQLSQEMRLAGKTRGVDWVAGLYYLRINHRIHAGIDALPDAYTLANANPDTLFPFKTDNAIRQTTESYAVFGQAEVPVNQALSVIAGLRWTQDRNHIEINPTCTNGFLPFACAVVAPGGTVQGDGFTTANSGGLNRQSKGDWSGRLQVNYRPDRNILLYAGVTRGQKGGGFNASAIAGIPAAITPYKPEVLTNYEAGFKTTLLSGSTHLNGSTYYYDYKNYQAYTLTGLTPTIFNTNARVIGTELELETRPVRGLTLSGSLAYLDAIAHNVRSNLLGTGINLGDQHMPQSPKWSGDGLIRYEFDALNGVVGLQTDARYNSRRYFNTVNHPALTDPQDVVINARISYTTADNRWEFALWGRNLTNATVYASGFDLAGTNGSTPLAVGPPRWFGGSIRLRIK
jgi:iron complex outermembrane receptor protein